MLLKSAKEVIETRFRKIAAINKKIDELKIERDGIIFTVIREGLYEDYPAFNNAYRNWETEN